MKIKHCFAMVCFLAVNLLKAADQKPITFVQVGEERLPVFAAKDTKTFVMEKPEYPKEEKERRVDGVAQLVVVVNNEGKVVDVQVKHSSPGAAFGEAAKAAMLKSRYRKMKWDGKPTGFIVSQAIRFHVN